MNEDILNLEETMEELGNISVATLYRMMRRGDIIPLADSPVLKRRRHLQFTRSEVQRVLREAQADKEAHSRIVA